METQKTLVGESKNKDVGKSTSRSKANGRFESYKKSVGGLRGIARPEILPFRENAGEISGVYDTQDSKPVGQPLNNWSPIITYTFTGFDGSSKEDGIAIREHKTPNESSTMIAENCVNYPTLSTELAHSTGRDYFRSGGQKIKQLTNQLRRLTPVECERLQGFPDDWTKYGIDEKGNKVEISDTQRYKMMGNAVTTKVITAIASKLVNEVKK
jgi:site-specific DNA-cytosine methylase